MHKSAFSRAGRRDRARCLNNARPRGHHHLHLRAVSGAAMTARIPRLRIGDRVQDPELRIKGMVVHTYGRATCPGG
jgi:hypothetical protein